MYESVVNIKVSEKLNGLGEKLRRLRKDHFVTQTQLAEYCSLSQGQISAVETGDSGVTIEILLYYCERFCTTPNALLGYSAESQSRIRATVDKLLTYTPQEIDTIMNLLETSRNHTE